MQRLLAPLALLTLSAAPVVAQGQVHVVDSLGGAGAQFADIAPAIAAAADGDTILIRPGVYTGFVVDGKDLDLFGDIDASTSAKVLTGRCVIRNVPPGKQVTLSDMRLTGGLDVVDADGPVVLQGLVFGDLFVGTSEPSNQIGLHVLRSKEVTLGRSWVGGYIGVGGTLALMSGPTAMRIEDSTVYAWDTEVYGGMGAEGVLSSLLFPGFGGTGLEVVDSTLRGDDVTVAGGSGGKGWSGSSCSQGFPGGTGLFQSGASTVVELRSSSLLPGPGGAGGSASSGSCGQGASGATSDLQGGLLTQLAGESRSYRTSFVAREGEVLPLIVEGGPTASGAVVLWLVADGPTSLPLGLAEGTLISSASAHLSVLGVAGPTGGLFVMRTVPELGPGVQTLPLVSQAALFATSGELRLTQPEATLLLDSAF